MLAAYLYPVVKGFFIEECGAPAWGLILAKLDGGRCTPLAEHGNIVPNGCHLPIYGALGNCPDPAVAISECSLQQCDVAAAERPIHLVEPCTSPVDRVVEMECMVAPFHPFGGSDELTGHHVDIV